MRGHLGWVVLLTILTVTAALIIRAVDDNSAAHQVARANAQAVNAIPARMATFGYRAARWRNDYFATIGLKVGLTSGSITAAVDRLADRGLVERRFDTEDRRARMVHLTAAGRKLVTAAFAARRTSSPPRRSQPSIG